MPNWLFQSNPRRYDVMADLMDGELGDYSWSIQRHAGDIKPGDKAALWIGGKKSPGVYAVGTVTGTPFADVADGSRWQRRGPRPPPASRQRTAGH